MSEHTSATAQPPKGRSPSYPSIPLNEAIDKARVVWSHTKKHPLPVASITDLWGYKSATTGPASTSYAALKKYGLLEDEGSGKDRRGRLTELAVEILNKHDPTDAIHRAAFTPPIMKEFWDQYGRDVPPIDSLHWDYVIERGFTENGLADFVRVYKATVAELAIDAPHSLSVDGENVDAQIQNERASSDENQAPSAPLAGGPHDQRSKQDVLRILVPIISSDPVTVEFPGKLAESDWDQFMAVLAAMKPGIVANAEQANHS